MGFRARPHGAGAKAACPRSKSARKSFAVNRNLSVSWKRRLPTISRETRSEPRFAHTGQATPAVARAHGAVRLRRRRPKVRAVHVSRRFTQFLFRLSARRRSWAWKCHAGCGGGDEADWLAKLRGLSNADACREYIRLAGVTAAQTSARPEKPLDWPQCVRDFTPIMLPTLPSGGRCHQNLSNGSKHADSSASFAIASRSLFTMLVARSCAPMSVP